MLASLIATALLVPSAPLSITLNVGGVQRQALVYVPSNRSPQGAPLVFGFHGHYGTSQFSARKFNFQSLWPEALVIYPQGLKTVSEVDPQGRGNGWQSHPGELGDRDVKFFDALMSWAKSKVQVDRHRVFVMGHSNGGSFTYVLAKTRASVIAAIAPASGGMYGLTGMTPIPVLQLSGETDKIVNIGGQNRVLSLLQNLNHCAPEPKAYAPNTNIYPGANGCDVAAYRHPGGHEYLSDESSVIVKFFREHAFTRPLTARD